MTQVPRWYWVAAGLALLWSLAGCGAYFGQVGMSAADMAALPPAQREIWSMMPDWVTAAYAIAVWVGLAGSVALLLRRRLARALYAVSLIAVLVQFGWTFLASPILTSVGPSAALFPAFIVVVSAALLWFASHAAARGWLR